MSTDLVDPNDLPREESNWSSELDQFLSEQALKTRPFHKPRGINEKQRFVRAMAEAFDIIGGVPRLALWADQNPDKFFSLYGKSIPGIIAQTNINTNGPVTIMSALGRSKLDEDFIEGEATEVPKDA
jgi:hypothetical protein